MITVTTKNTAAAASHHHGPASQITQYRSGVITNPKPSASRLRFAYLASQRPSV